MKEQKTMAIVKGKVEKVTQRDGQKGPYWFATINGTEYYCGDEYIADKEGKFVTMEHYTTKSGKNALKSTGNGSGGSAKPDAPAQETGGKKDWVPRYRDTKEYDILDKAFACRTMSMAYAKDIVGRAYEGVPRPAGPGSDMTLLVKSMTLDTLKVYMALHDTIALGTDIKRAEEVLLMTQVDARPGVETQSGGTPPPVSEKMDNRPALKRVLIETAAQVGVVPLKAMKKYIGKSVKSLDDLTAEDLMKYIEILTKEKESADQDVPF